MTGPTKSAIDHVASLTGMMPGQVRSMLEDGWTFESSYKDTHRWIRGEVVISIDPLLDLPINKFTYSN